MIVNNDNIARIKKIIRDARLEIDNQKYSEEDIAADFLEIAILLEIVL